MQDPARRSVGGDAASHPSPSVAHAGQAIRRAARCLLAALLVAACTAPAVARDTRATGGGATREAQASPDRVPAPRLGVSPGGVPRARGVDAPVATFSSTARTLYSCCLLNSVAATDINGDGRLDIVSGNGMTFDFSVLLATGPGTYAEAQNYLVGLPEVGRVVVAIGDMNGDGSPDAVATGSSPAGKAWLYLNDGDGAFGAAREFPLGRVAFVQAVEVADVNGDGRLDVVTANSGSADVSVLLGNGNGGFGTAHVFPVPQGPEGLVVGDADGDGDADILTTGRTDHVVAILAGDGAGGFAAATTLQLGRNADPFDVTLADIDDDGDRDIVTSNAGSDGSEFPPIELPGSVSLLRSNGQGGFAAAQTIVLDGTVGRAHAVAVGDLTADGRADIAVSQTNGNVATVLVGDGSGGFGERLVRPTGMQPAPLAIGDVTGDGRPDLVTGNTESISVLPGDGEGDVGFRGRHGVGAVPHAVTTGDVDGDGRPDVLTADTGSSTLSVLRNTGDGGMGPAVSYEVGADPTSIATGDLNGDGHLDAVLADLGGGTVSVVLGDGDGRFAPSTQFPIGTGFQSPYALALGDADGDGDLDVATANTNISNESVSVLLGDGEGGLGAPETYRVGTTDYNSPQGIVMADVTGDGNADIVTANIGSSSLSLFVGEGDGDFAEAQSLVAGDGPVMVAAGDVDGDGHADLVSLDHTGQTVSVLVSDGAGGFAPARTYDIFPPQSQMLFMPWPWGLSLGDVDGDGDLDIATANTQNDTVSVLANDGSGEFPEYLNFGAGAKPGAVAIADIDGDDRTDLVVANRENHDIAVLFGGNGDGFADLAVDVGAAPGNVAPGATLHFDAAVANRGPAAAGFPGLGMAFDAELADLAVDPPQGWSCDAPETGGGTTSIACTAPELAADAATVFAATATAPAAADGDVITMTAAATSTTPDPANGDNSDAVSVSVNAVTDLSVAIDGPQTFTRGSVVSYAIELDNLGPATAPQASLSIVLNVPAQSVALTAPDGWSCVPHPTSTYAATCTRAGAVPVDAGAAFEAAVTVGRRLFPPRITVRARAASSANDPDASDNAATLVSRWVRSR